MPENNFDYGTNLEKIKLVNDSHDIREVIINWAFWRDKKEFDKVKSCFHEEGAISVSFYSGSIDGFIEIAEKMGKCKHYVGNIRLEIKNNHAVSESNTVVMIRIKDEDGNSEVDITTYLRFIDFFEKREGQWKIVSRTAVYEKDRIDPVNPNRSGFSYPEEDLKLYPQACKHLCFIIERGGSKYLKSGIVLDGSPEESELFDKAKKWLNDL